MEHVYLHINGGFAARQTLEEMFAYNVRYQVLCQTQDQYDLLKAYQLMFSRELELDIFDTWQCKVAMRRVQMLYDHSKMPLRLLPFVYTTWPNANLRDL